MEVVVFGEYSMQIAGVWELAIQQGAEHSLSVSILRENALHIC